MWVCDAELSVSSACVCCHASNICLACSLAFVFTHTHTHSLCSEVLLIQPVRQRGDTDRLLFTQSLVHPWELRSPPEAQARTSATVQTLIKNVSSVFRSCFYFFLAVSSVSCFFTLVFQAASKCSVLGCTCRLCGCAARKSARETHI